MVFTLDVSITAHDSNWFWEYIMEGDTEVEAAEELNVV